MHALGLSFLPLCDSNNTKAEKFLTTRNGVFLMSVVEADGGKPPDREGGLTRGEGRKDGTKLSPLTPTILPPLPLLERRVPGYLPPAVLPTNPPPRPPRRELYRGKNRVLSWKERLRITRREEEGGC